MPSCPRDNQVIHGVCSRQPRCGHHLGIRPTEVARLWACCSTPGLMTARPFRAWPCGSNFVDTIVAFCQPGCLGVGHVAAIFASWYPGGPVREHAGSILGHYIGDHPNEGAHGLGTWQPFWVILLPSHPLGPSGAGHVVAILWTILVSSQPAHPGGWHLTAVL